MKKGHIYIMKLLPDDCIIDTARDVPYSCAPRGVYVRAGIFNQSNIISYGMAFRLGLIFSSRRVR